MVIATYKRDANLPPLLKHLTTNPPPSLRHIVLVWQNIGVPLPSFLNDTALEGLSTSGVAVTVRESKQNSMNERFRPLLRWEEEIYTDAVMIMDDDVVLVKEALEWGYQEFVGANSYGPGRIVGFTGRDFEEEKGGKEWGYIVKPRKSYSMVLSNAAWLRKEWLQKYWEDTEEMRGLRDYVDEGTVVFSFSFAPQLTVFLPSLQLRRHPHQLPRLEPHRQPSPPPSTQNSPPHHRRRRPLVSRVHCRQRRRGHLPACFPSFS